MGPEMMVQAPAYRERSRVSLFFTLVAGFAAGLLAFYLLVVPAIRQRIYREANQQIVSYSDAVSSQGAELTKAQSQVKESDDTVEAASAQIAQEQKKSSTYQALLEAYAAYKQQNMDEAALKLQNVYVNVLPDDLKSIYNTISNDTGVTGIDESADGSESSSAAGQADSSGDNADSAGDTGAEDSGEGYSDSGDGSYDDSSYDDSSYDEGNYDDSEY